MAKTIKSIRNKTNVSQSIVYKGKQLILNPKEERAFPGDIADQFLEDCENYVELTPLNLGMSNAKAEDKKTIWIANVTGNPDLPETIPYVKLSGKDRISTTIPNPKREARTIARRFHLGMKEIQKGDGTLDGLNLGNMLISLEPFTRRELPKEIGEWFLHRDNLGEKEFTGACARSRAPTEFEPDMTWELDDMRLYLRLVDPKALQCRSDHEVRIQAVAAEQDVDIALFEEKALCMKRLFFRLIDTKYRVPTAMEFTKLKEAEEKRLLQAAKGK